MTNKEEIWAVAKHNDVKNAVLCYCSYCSADKPFFHLQRREDIDEKIRIEMPERFFPLFRSIDIHEVEFTLDDNHSVLKKEFDEWFQNQLIIMNL